MAAYQTKQRKLLLDFFKSHPDETLSAKQIAEQLADRGISLSAVYRNLALLEKTGNIHRLTRTQAREIYYQYRLSACCQKSLHLSCTQCGAIFHMQNAHTDALITYLQEQEHFLITCAENLLYGVCEHCQKE